MVVVGACIACLVVSLVAETTPPGVGGGASEFEEALDSLPADVFALDGSPVLYYVDMELAWQRAGIGSDADERLENLGALAAATTWVQFPQLFGSMSAMVDEARAEVGFSAVEISREIAVLAPPHSIIVADTVVSPGQVRTAVNSDPMWASDLEVVDIGEVEYFQWGDDPGEMDFERVTPMRPLGHGGNLAVLGDDIATVVRTIFPGDIESTLSALADNDDSLLDTGAFDEALGVVGADHVLQAILVPGPNVRDPLSLSDPEVTEAETEPLLAYAATLIAQRYDGERSLTEILLIHADAASALANAKLIEEMIAQGVDPSTNRPLREIFPDAEVTVTGSVVQVSVDVAEAYRLAVSMLFSRSLFPSG